VRQTLTAGEAMSTSLKGTLITFDALMKRFGVGEPKPPAPAPGTGKPFDILDYATAAKEINGMAAQLDVTLKNLAAALDTLGTDPRREGLERLGQQAEAQLRASLNYAFFLAAALVLLTFGCALATEWPWPGSRGPKRGRFPPRRAPEL